MEMEMKIEAGKYYKTRDGRKVGPMSAHRDNQGDKDDIWMVGNDSLSARWQDGTSAHDHSLRPSDLVAEWTDGPVVTETVTKTRIVPGVYGAVTVGAYDNKSVVAYIGMTFYNADELDAAAAILTQLAEGLRNAQ